MMTKCDITLVPSDMNRDNMKRLEDRGLIHRIAPGNDVAGPVDGNNLGRSIYESDEKFGGHKLIVATIGATDLRYFGCHDDNEDVFLLGHDYWRPMFFVIGACLVDEFEDKVRKGALTKEDFVCLRTIYNDPEASFFVMKKHVPHGEFVVPTDANAPSFYVTESTNLKVRPISLGSHSIKVLDSLGEYVVNPK